MLLTYGEYSKYKDYVTKEEALMLRVLYRALETSDTLRQIEEAEKCIELVMVNVIERYLKEYN